jgi:hypothetical protein
MIPLIASNTAGPLGVLHLPRLWLKPLLQAMGQLPPGYKDIRPGFDFMVLKGLKIDPDAARDYILQTRPTYLEFETWIKNQPGVDLSEASIAAVNVAVLTRKKSDSSRQKILGANGLPDDGSITDSILLNALDDWQSVHRDLTN